MLWARTEWRFADSRRDTGRLCWAKKGSTLLMEEVGALTRGDDDENRVRWMTSDWDDILSLPPLLVREELDDRWLLLRRGPAEEDRARPSPEDREEDVCCVVDRNSLLSDVVDDFVDVTRRVLLLLRRRPLWLPSSVLLLLVLVLVLVVVDTEVELLIRCLPLSPDNDVDVVLGRLDLRLLEADLDRRLLSEVEEDAVAVVLLLSRRLVRRLLVSNSLLFVEEMRLPPPPPSRLLR